MTLNTQMFYVRNCQIVLKICLMIFKRFVNCDKVYVSQTLMKIKSQKGDLWKTLSGKSVLRKHISK